MSIVLYCGSESTTIDSQENCTSFTHCWEHISEQHPSSLHTQQYITFSSLPCTHKQKKARKILFKKTRKISCFLRHILIHLPDSTVSTIKHIYNASPQVSFQKHSNSLLFLLFSYLKKTTRILIFRCIIFASDFWETKEIIMS